MSAKRIVVVGAGPAGMMAAIRAGGIGQDVILIEKNPFPGKKLLLSGKGRCNLTNVCDFDSFIKRFSQGAEFLRDALRKFFHQDLIRFFEERGLKLKIERQLRVFPANNKAKSISDVLIKELHKNKVKILCRMKLKDIVIQEGRIKGLILDNKKVIAADALILATGGVSYGFTGSTGDGLGIARKLGHRIVPLRAGLVPLETRQETTKLLKGLTLKNIRLKFCDGTKHITSETGELLFTDFGISGPLVLSLSGKIVDWIGENKHIFVEIDLKPALSEEQLNNRLLREFKLYPKKNIRNALKGYLPVRLVDVFIELLKISHPKKVNQVTQQERRQIAHLLKALRLDITGSQPIEEAMITRGGVSLKEINPRTMESRIIKGLYFAGEMLDVDADTGGFNLQAAFSTGYLAGESAALN